MPTTASSVPRSNDSWPTTRKRIEIASWRLPALTELDSWRRPESAVEQFEAGVGESHEGTNGVMPIAGAAVPPDLAGFIDYTIKRLLGRGGMGVVYLAENRLMGRDEVLKVTKLKTTDVAEHFERSLREIRAVAKLRHPNIITAYRAVQLGENLILAMEYVDGSDLARVVKARGPLSMADACNYAYQTALGLQHAHEHGLVHRDIKPSNLMLAREGGREVVKILDFGLARVRSDEHNMGAVTHEGQMIGTPDFIAPEQIRDARRADIRADIYSLGATFYYLLTGAPPFPRNSIYDILQAHHSADATPLNLLRPEVPVELASLVGRMMAKEPDLRFNTPAELAAQLLPFLKAGDLGSPLPCTAIATDGQTASCVELLDVDSPAAGVTSD